jgi:hypothetical protein
MKNVKITLIIASLFLMKIAFCADIYWTGSAGNKKWTNASNWSPQQIPSSLDNVFFINPPVGSVTVEIQNENAFCNNLYFNGSGYTLEITGTSILNIISDVICNINNTIYNRADLIVGADMELGGFLNNNFGGNLIVNNEMLITLSGEIDNTGNAGNASAITCYNMINYGTIDNEDSSQITIINILTNHAAFSNYKFAVLEVQSQFYNYGTLHNNKQTDLNLFGLFENHGTYISEDKALLNGSGTVDIYNYGTIQNIDHSNFFDIQNVYNFNLISNENKGEFYVLNNIENSGTINNDFYIEVGLDYSNFTGSVLINTDEIYSTGSFYNDGSVDNQNAITVNTGLNVDINGTVINSGCFTVNGNILIDGAYTGSLLNYGTIGGAGIYTYNRNTGGSGLPLEYAGWHFISTPVTGMSCNDIYDYWINDWAESINFWYNYSPGGTPCVAGPDNPFESVKGYCIKRDLEYACGAINPPTGAVVEFTGIAGNVQTGGQSIPVTGSDFEPGDPAQLNNWNLVGNPYPSAVDANQIIFPPEIDNAIYYYNDATLNYESFVGGVGQPFIPVAQGFFVHLNTAGTFSFNLDNTTRACNGQNAWYKDEITHVIGIEVTGSNGLSDITYLRELNDATPDFDKLWDAYKLLTDVQEVPQIYSLSKNIKYSINSFDKMSSVPLIFKSGGDGYYTLHASGTDDFGKVYLEDKSTGIIQDLKTEYEYTFVSGSGDQSARFLLHLNDNTLTADNEVFVIYARKNNIYVINQEGLEGEISIINLMGQSIAYQALQDGLNRIPVDQADGIYFVSISTLNYSLNQKVFCK